MYNRDIKKEFVQTYTSETRRNAAQNMFNIIGKYEDEWRADVCTVGIEQLKPMMTELSGARSSSFRFYLSILRGYVNWVIEGCRINGACRSVFEINQPGVEKFRKQMVVNPEHLQLYMDCLFDSEEDETVDNIYRCYFWLAFVGLDEEDAISVKCADISLKRMSVIANENEYPLPKESSLAFKNCVTLDSFRLNHPIYTIDVRHDRVAGDELLRGVKTGASAHTIREAISRRQKNKSSWRGKMRLNPNVDMDLKLSYGRVKLSGLFYRQYEIEKKTKTCPDFVPVALEFMGDYQYKLDKSRNSREAKVRQVTAGYLRDYERWKDAYSLPSYYNG